MEPQGIIDALNLRPHPEGGWFVETWRGSAEDGRRPSGSAIYFLLTRGSDAQPHRIDATEVWHYYAGAVVELTFTLPDGTESAHLIGPDVRSGQRPQGVVPPGAWQRARTLGDYSLMGCTVSPAFEWPHFELK
ncbi:MAG: cupin domain-containing protein [Acidimicrobiales bacterium]